jgi:hypothetical protein
MMVHIRFRYVVEDVDRHGNVRIIFDARAVERFVCQDCQVRLSSWPPTKPLSPA